MTMERDSSSIFLERILKRYQQANIAMVALNKVLTNLYSFVLFNEK